MIKKVLIYALLLIVSCVVLIGVAYFTNSSEAQEQKESNLSDESESQHDFSLAYERIRNYLQEINGNGYSFISIDFPKQHVIADNLVQVYADVVMEKEGVYDWLRLRVVLEDEQLAVVERVDIPYYERVTQVERVPFDSEEAIRQALKSVSSEDRDWFGINLRSFHVGSRGMNIEVTDISAVAANEDLTEVLAKISVDITMLNQVREGAYLVYLRKYEQTKWQIEDIQFLKGGFLP